MQPNTIIAALLDIASAAFNYTHATKGEPASEAKQVLRERVGTLDPLVGQFIRSQKNPPECAREILQSFLESGDDLASLIEKRTRMFPRMTITLADQTPEQKEALRVAFANPKVRDGLTVFPVLTAGADVQIGSIEFEPQEWKAPATGPGFTPTAEFPASGPISHDFYTHRSSWRDIIVKCIEQTKGGRAVDDVRDMMDIDADTSYLEHELRAFDRAFDSLPPQQERRMRPRMIDPIKPEASDTRPIVDATRPLFVKAMQSQGYRADFDGFTGLFKDASEHRWEGWKAAVEAMGFRVSEAEDIGSMREARKAMDAVCDALTKHAPGWQALTPRGTDSAVQAIEQLATSTKNEIRTNMLADTADEALKIINDAGLLKNLVELLDKPLSTLRMGEYKGLGWTVEVDYTVMRSGRKYTSTSLHQAIVEAHKGERDLAEQIAAGFEPTVTNSRRRELMVSLLMEVKDTINVDLAKKIISEVGKSPNRMADIAEDKIEDVIRACEMELNK